MQVGKVGSNIINKAIVWAKTSKNATRIIQTKTKMLDSLSLAKLKYCADDIYTSTKKLISFDDTLFSWAKRKTPLSMSKIDPDSIVLVHRTKYFPKNGEILSTNFATKTADGVGQARTTIHFSLNKPITEHNLGANWDKMEYSIIAPFKETVKSMPKSKVLGGLQDDFFFQDVVKLPKGSVIVKYNPDVPSQRFLISDAFDGIKLLETSDKDLNKVSNVVIKKMGYTPYDEALKNFLSATDKEMSILTSMPESQLKDQINTIVNNGGFAKTKENLKENLKLTLDMFSDNNIPMAKEYIKSAKENYNKNIEVMDVLEKYAKKLEAFPNSWKKYCANEKLFNGLHSQTPWFKTEISLNGIDICEKANNNSWGKDLKNIIIKSLEDAQANIPEGKSLGVDSEKLIQIIKSSKTPKDARLKIEKELKIKAMPALNGSEIGTETLGEDYIKNMLEILGLNI